MTDQPGRPPVGAIHGPFNYSGGHAMPGTRGYDGGALRAEPKERIDILAAISVGQCKCACCRFRGEPKPMPEDWVWIRRMTAKQKRSGHAASVVSWPIWIFDGTSRRRSA